ncbi:hypothetical protein E4U42_002059 [Claviceps africana]|uniref:Uncharacterized protein n=1 Tax=Claviceps africana TaxID=83212 RepID=A0A8K0NK07_9HYPO|nr:hypothetical protein E4U42_002059 [Claviceps africana]
MDSTNSSQSVYHGVGQNLGHIIIGETSAATEQGATAWAGDGNDKEKGKENAGQNVEDSSAERTSMSDDMSMSPVLDDDAENMPSGSYESWVGMSEPSFWTEATDDNDSGSTAGNADADEKLRAVLRAMRRRRRPSGLTVAAVDGEAACGSAAEEEDWGDVRVLDCSDEVWEQILRDSAGESFEIWEDGRAE